jgi:hypothetical protein
MSIILLISQVVILFLNCILTIDNYNNSYCAKSSVECQSYINVSPTITSTENQNTTLNLSSVSVTCDNAASINNQSLKGKWIISILFLGITILLLGLSILLVIKNEDDDIVLYLLTILVCILNIIVSSFSLFIYAKCIDTNMTCEPSGPFNKSPTEKNSFYGVCNGVVENHKTAYGMYVFMILLLCGSLVSGIASGYYMFD